MIAPVKLPWRYRLWNARWGAPFGNRGSTRFRPLVNTRRGQDLLKGPFGHQTNNTTRRFEYPWAFEQIRPRKGMRILEIGGGLSGLQFVLSRVGCDVTNVDPGVDSYGRDWGLDEIRFAELNATYGTEVSLVRRRLEEASLEAGSFDAVVSISVLEHLGVEVAREVIRLASSLLRVGGRIVLTVDLFPDLAPFTGVVGNSYGSNVSVKDIAGDCQLIVGDRSQLFGFPEFEVDGILRKRDGFLLGVTPAWAQCLVLAPPNV